MCGRIKEDTYLGYVPMFGRRGRLYCLLPARKSKVQVGKV